MAFAAITASARATVRQRRAAVVLMTIAASLLFGAALGSLAGARRSSSALDRFLDDYGAEDVYLVYPEDGSLDPEAVHRLPQVRSAEHQSYLGMVLVGADGRPHPDLAGEINPYLYVPTTPSAAVDRLHIVAGREVDRARPLEVVVDEATARDADLEVGDRLPMAAYAASQIEAFSDDPGAGIAEPEGPILDLEVVGITRMPVDIHPDDERTTSFGGTKDIYLSPALFEEHGDELLVFNPPVPGSPEALRLVHGPDDLDAFREALRTLPGGEGAQVDLSDSDTLGSARNVRRAIGVETAVLYALAGALACSGVALIGFAMMGVARAQTEELRVLRAIGLRPSEVGQVAAAPSAVAAVVGTVGSILVAIAMSPRLPIGLGRQAELDHGFDADPLVLGVGAAVLLVAGVGGAVLASRPTARSLAAGADAPTAGRSLADVLAGAGAPLAPTLGARYLGGRRPQARGAPVRSAVLTGAVAIAAITGVATYLSTLSHLVHSPAEQGAGWDLALGNINLSDYSSADVERLESVPGIDGVTSAAAMQGRGSVDDIDVAIAGIDQASGDVGPTMVRGRLPQRDGEVVLGRHTATELGADLGDEVEVRAGPEGRTSATVVGIALLNSNISPTMQIGDGALVTVEQLREMVPEQPVTFLLAGVRDGADVDHVIGEIRDAWGESGNAAPPLLSGDVANLERVQHLPAALALGLGVTAVGLLAFALALSSRQRRSELALLRAIGATRRQSTAALTWQGVWIALGAAIIGVPAGIIAGRAVWSRLADGLGAITEPVVPWPRVTALVVVAVVMSAAIASVPARLAHRHAPAATLRTE